MLLQCHNQDVWHGIPVDVTTKFEDMLMFAQFVEKLASVAGYQQSRVVKCDSSESMTSDSGDDDASASRTYEIHPKGFGASKTGTVKYLVKNVMLQSPSNQNAGRVFRGRGGGGPAAGVFVDLAEVDVFVELVTASSEAALNAEVFGSCFISFTKASSLCLESNAK
ncbi:unnamed protein product, partial [Mesorhabditis belari]|uniref:Uncharacterized protein n=1 Tax=Mesorhabditis belari TaxID=2138241 RepID=A0AAF3ECS8_9BILA